MDEFMVRCKQVMGCGDELINCAGFLKGYAGDTDSVRRNLRGKISSYDQIGNRLKQIAGCMEEECRKLESLGNGAHNIGRTYSDTENRITGKEISEEKVGAPEEEGFSWEFGDLASDVLGEFGVIGTGISSVASWVTGGGKSDAVDWFLNVGDDAVGIGDGIREIVEDKLPIAEWFGFGASDYASDAKFWDRFKSNLGKEAKETFDYMDGSNWSKALGVLGTAFTVGEAAKDNYDEYKRGEIGAVRAVAETAGEVAVDWAIGIGVTALAAAALPVGAPAVAVGAATVVVTWAVDKAFEWATGKNASEFISDTILDGAAKAVQSAGKAVADWWGGLW